MPSATRNPLEHAWSRHSLQPRRLQPHQGPEGGGQASAANSGAGRDVQGRMVHPACARYAADVTGKRRNTRLKVRGHSAAAHARAIWFWADGDQRSSTDMRGVTEAPNAGFLLLKMRQGKGACPAEWLRGQGTPGQPWSNRNEGAGQVCVGGLTHRRLRRSCLSSANRCRGRHARRRLEAASRRAHGAREVEVCR